MRNRASPAVLTEPGDPTRGRWLRPMRTRQTSGPSSRYSQVNVPGRSASNRYQSGLGSWSLTSSNAVPDASDSKVSKIGS